MESSFLFTVFGYTADSPVPAAGSTSVREFRTGGRFTVTCYDYERSVDLAQIRTVV
jgi:hypothetical protein